MRICDGHWAALREAIEDRGVGHLVCRDGEEAAKLMAAALKGEEPKWVDPLLSANNMIMCRAVEAGGLGMLSGDLCPICEAMKGYAEVQPPEVTEREWIDGPADAALEQCRDAGLVPTPGIQEPPTPPASGGDARPIGS